MSDIGQSGSKRPKRDRPKKSPEILLKEKEQELEIREQKIQELLDKAVKLFKIPYDDRGERPPDAPTISYVANEMNTPRMQVRKLLITADFYSSEMSRRIIELQESGTDIKEISEKTGLGTFMCSSE